MKKVIADLSSKNNMLNKLVDSLDGVLPYMTKSEQVDYDSYAQEIRQNYENILKYNKIHFSEDNQIELKKLVTEHEETYTCRNALLNDLYYKDGIRDGICLLLECLRSEN